LVGRSAAQEQFPLQIKSRFLLAENDFRIFLTREVRRLARSQKGLVLVLVSVTPKADNGQLQALVTHLSNCLRMTDCLGWHEAGKTLGVLFTEIDAEKQKSSAELLRSRVALAISAPATASLSSQVSVTTYRAQSQEPESWLSVGS
jgi:hypothetical protein